MCRCIQFVLVIIHGRSSVAESFSQALKAHLTSSSRVSLCYIGKHRQKGHETRCYYDCSPSMYGAFHSLIVAESWKKMNSFMYLENNTMPTITISVICSVESTCYIATLPLLWQQLTLPLPLTILSLEHWHKAHRSFYSFIHLYCKIQKHYSAPGFETMPGYHQHQPFTSSG